MTEVIAFMLLGSVVGMLLTSDYPVNLLTGMFGADGGV